MMSLFSSAAPFMPWSAPGPTNTLISCLHPDRHQQWLLLGVMPWASWFSTVFFGHYLFSFAPHLTASLNYLPPLHYIFLLVVIKYYRYTPSSSSFNMSAFFFFGLLTLSNPGETEECSVVLRSSSYDGCLPVPRWAKHSTAPHLHSLVSTGWN